MKYLNPKHLIFVCVVFLLAGISVPAQTTDAAKNDSPVISDKQRAEFEKVIREYLIKNPSVIREAIEALQAQEEAEKSQQATAALKSRRADLYFDPESPVAGNPEGDVTIIAFFDYNCGYCKTNLPVIKNLAATDGSIRLIFKEMPILDPSSEVAAHAAALAAHRQGKYFAFHDALIGAKTANERDLRAISTRIGINYETLKKDMADPKLSKAIQRNLSVAHAIGIDGTPAYVIGEQVIGGAVDAEDLARMVQSERTKQKNASPAKISPEL